VRYGHANSNNFIEKILQLQIKPSSQGFQEPHQDFLAQKKPMRSLTHYSFNHRDKDKDWESLDGLNSHR
jgi:hypothetical protein